MPGTIGQVFTAVLSDHPPGSPDTLVCVKSVRVFSDVRVEEVESIVSNVSSEWLVQLIGISMHSEGYWMLVQEFMRFGALKGRSAPLGWSETQEGFEGGGGQGG